MELDEVESSGVVGELDCMLELDILNIAYGYAVLIYPYPTRLFISSAKYLDRRIYLVVQIRGFNMTWLEMA